MALGATVFQICESSPLVNVKAYLAGHRHHPMHHSRPAGAFVARCPLLVLLLNVSNVVVALAHLRPGRFARGAGAGRRGREGGERAQGGEGGARRRLQLVVDEARLTLSLFFLLVATLVIKCERL